VAARPITFLSDYGGEDEFAGVCRGVIARIAPGAPLIDLAHELPRHDVRRAAVALADALPYAPPGVHLAVVDPGVGTERRPVAMRVEAEQRVLVGPDNGLLWPAATVLGGAVEAVNLARTALRLEPVSATFHGRDLFAPVAAGLAIGAALTEVGEPIEVGSLARLALPAARVEADRVVAQVLYLDRFGNAALNAPREVLVDGPLRRAGSIGVEAARASGRARFARAFAEVAEGELLLYEDSSRRLALAVNRGSAAELLGVGAGSEVVLRPS
jgi:S-adenosyl-L-methionine hydrolase (adenosine-forming)